jgi:glycosyltransferase involved in cell wall biosynthesis
MDVSVVIPVKDEQDNLRPLLEQVRSALDPERLEYEVVFVDDGSGDGTFDTLRLLAAADARVKVVRLQRNFGQTPALRAGLDASAGDVIVTMDGDLQNDPADIPIMLAHLREGYDVVLGWRKDRKDGFFLRKLPSKIANALIRKATRVNVQDLGCTLRVMKRDVAMDLPLYGEMHRFISVLLQNSGYKLLQVPVRHHPRQFGQTKYNLSRTVRVLLDLITVKFLHGYLTRPMHIFGVGGLLSMFGGFLSLAVCVAQKLIWDERMNRNPLLLLSVLLVVVGVQFFSLGLLGELMSRTYFESQGKAVYRVRETLNLEEREDKQRRAA